MAKSSAKSSKSVYFAGELFCLKHLIGNAYLAESIHAQSHGKYLCQLPQDFELRGSSPKAIRDKDIRNLLDCDLALFNFDGTELDSGTVVEFMIAKFADIPSVILRSDFRAAGDQNGGDPWNLMASFYPRTLTVSLPSIALYKKFNKARTKVGLSSMVRLAGHYSSAAAQDMSDAIAQKVVAAFDQVSALPPAMPPHLQVEVYEWLSLMPGFNGKAKTLRREFEKRLANKINRGLL